AARTALMRTAPAPQVRLRVQAAAKAFMVVSLTWDALVPCLGAQGELGGRGDGEGRSVGGLDEAEGQDEGHERGAGGAGHDTDEGVEAVHGHLPFEGQWWRLASGLRLGGRGRLERGGAGGLDEGEGQHEGHDGGAHGAGHIAEQVRYGGHGNLLV